MKNKLLKLLVLGLTGIMLAGCTFVFQSGRRSDMEKIEELQAQLDRLARSKGGLEDKLSQEIKDKQVKLQMMEKGLVITVVGDLVFDSGKAVIRTEAYSLLNKVAGILKDDLAGYKIGIEGHTDNQPIKASGWKSNWELSSHRALSVLYYLCDKQGIDPDRLSAIGYGEYQPVASNGDSEGRQLNRRVEIVIMPRITKVAKDRPEGSSLEEPSGNLK